jgi:cytochrome c oxidase assembly protein subunit 15
MLWVALGLLSPQPRTPAVASSLRRHGHGVTALIAITILAGGFVAGTRAGFAFNDWPLMHGRWIPEGLYAMQPLWADFFENVATVQFHHRLLAYLLCLALPAWWWLARRATLAAGTRWLFHLLLAALLAQVALGIATLLTIVPAALAAAHQAGALLLLTLALLLNHALRAGKPS